MERIFFFLVLVCLTLGCNPSNQGGGQIEQVALPSFDPNSYMLEDIPGSTMKKAIRRDSIGVLLEEGYLEGEIRQGIWTTYHKGLNVPATLTSYIDGSYNGKYLEFNDRGQLTLIATYRNNLLDGPWEVYNFGRVIKSATYLNGKLNGIYREYHPTKMNILEKEIEYKNGVQDGVYRFYNEEGMITVEYVYRNGKKVSGGIVE